MNAMQIHRGPDAEGLWGEEGIVLGHRRLQIIDNSERAGQPMQTPCGRYTMVYNGEVHNYLELRQELGAEGVRFLSASDTEVVLHAFVRWGLSCFNRFNGMWALALWDSDKRELLLCRDRFGIKPLCYSQRGSRLVFASEPKAILCAYPEEREVNEDELYNFIAGGSPDSDGTTFYRNIHAVPPNTYLRFGERSAPQRGTYWALPLEESSPEKAPEVTLCELLDDAVRVRMRSDVTVGAMLSGGLDSSAVVRLAMRRTEQPLPCYSLKYDGSSLDESSYAAGVANDPNKTPLHWVTPAYDDVLAVMRKIVWHHDAPTPLRARLPHWSVMQRASKDVRVVLSGSGADELLAGYGRFIAPHLRDTWNRCRHPALAMRSLRMFNAHDESALASLVVPFKKFACLGRAGTKRLIEPAWRKQRRIRNADRYFNTWMRRDTQKPFSTHLNNALWSEFAHAGVPETMHAEDAISMAHSVETRSPFMDHRVVEYCFSLPGQMKVHDTWSKHVLRKAMEGVLPPQVQWRKDKKGFPAPYVAWLTSAKTLSGLRGLLLDGRTLQRGILHGRGVERCIDSFAAKKGRSFSDTEVIWRLATLEMWYRDFIDADLSYASQVVTPDLVGV